MLLICMRRIVLIGLATTILGGICPAAAQPQVYTIGLVFSDRVDTTALPPHMQRQHPVVVRDLHRNMRRVFAALGRFRTLQLQISGEEGRPIYLGAQSVDFVAHITLNKAYKIYSNQVFYFKDGGFLYTRPDKGGRDGGAPYEVISLPAITGQLEAKLVDPHKDRIFWSILRDSTTILPYDEQTFLYNSWKYPGLSHPGLVRLFLADILRLQQMNSSVARALNVSDRWFVSAPSHDTEITAGLLQGLAASFAADLDSNLPLEGRIEAMLPEQQGKLHVLLNIGERHGLRPRLRLGIWRPLPSTQKVGQIEVVEVDSTTAVARLRKLDKKLKKRGEGLQILDRVISLKRPARRSL
jgi:hypothetical protein